MRKSDYIRERTMNVLIGILMRDVYALQFFSFLAQIFSDNWYEHFYLIHSQCQQLTKENNNAK